MQKLTAHGLTDVGLQRAHNEDTFAIATGIDFFVVCDGMGGHASGEVASRICAENAVAFVQKNLNGNASNFPYKTSYDEFECSLLSNAVQYANDRVYIEGMKDSKLEGMGTTIVAIRALQDEVVLAHVGDSRIYRWRHGGKLEQLTRDHSLLNFKIDRGELTTAEEIANFKQGNVIVRAIGLKDEVVPEVSTVSRRAGDIFLLCSDGLTDLVDDWSIENVLEANYDELDEACACLIRMANDRGGKDNITVLLVRVDDDPSDDDEMEEVTDPTGIEALTEDTQPRGIAAVSDDDFDDDVEDATADTDPRMRRVQARPAARHQPIEDYEEEDDDWYSDDFEVDYREDDEVDPLGGGEITFGDVGRGDREEVLEESWRMTGGRTDVATDPTLQRVETTAPGVRSFANTPVESDPNYLDDDEPVSFGRPPGRLAARRAKKPPSSKMPSVAPRARVGGRRGDEPDPNDTSPALRRPPSAAPVIKAARKPTAPPPLEEDDSGLPSIIIDDSLLE